MTEELNNNTAPETVEAVETVTPSPAKKKKKLPVILGVVVSGFLGLLFNFCKFRNLVIHVSNVCFYFRTL